MLARILLLLEFFRIASRHGNGVLGRQMEVHRSCLGSPHPLVELRSWLILIIAVKQHQFWGFRRITAQSNSNIQALGKIACCPSDRPDNMVHETTAKRTGVVELAGKETVVADEEVEVVVLDALANL